MPKPTGPAPKTGSTPTPTAGRPTGVNRPTTSPQPAQPKQQAKRPTGVNRPTASPQPTKPTPTPGRPTGVNRPTTSPQPVKPKQQKDPGEARKRAEEVQGKVKAIDAKRQEAYAKQPFKKAGASNARPTPTPPQRPGTNPPPRRAAPIGTSVAPRGISNKNTSKGRGTK
jgi:hypothetical protein